MEFAGDDFSASYSLTARRNCSISAAGLFCFFCVIAGVSLGIAGVFAVLGAWPILPFAGLELLALGIAFHYAAGHAGDYEQIEVSGDKVRVERQDRSRIARWEFNRYWVQVVLDERGREPRLALRSHGRELEVGRFLSGSRRIQLARQLRRFTNNYR